MPKKFKSHKNIVKILSISMFFILGVVCALLFSNFIVPVSNQLSGQIKSPEFDIYFLSVNKSQLEASAKQLASDLQSQNGGGYVWKKDNYYYVITSAYANKNDAVLVQNDLKTNTNIESEIFSVHFNSISFDGSFDSESKKVLQKALNIFQSSFLTLFDIAISLDTEVYNEISSRLAVNSNHSTINSVVADFQTVFSGVENENIKNLENSLNKLQKISTNLCSGTTINKGQTYSSLIKYRYLEILDVYYQFISSQNIS